MITSPTNEQPINNAWENPAFAIDCWLGWDYRRISYSVKSVANSRLVQLI
jgi:hypothetical protein